MKKQESKCKKYGKHFIRKVFDRFSIIDHIEKKKLRQFFKAAITYY